MSNHKGPLWLKAGVILAIVTVAGACGSSSSKSSAPTVGSAATAGSTPSVSSTSGHTGAAAASCSSTTGVSPTQVKVGVLWSQTGSFSASNGAFGAGVRARIDEANDSGGVNGRKIAEVDADNQSDPAKALVAAQGLVESNGVVALVNGLTSAAPMFPYLNSNKIPAFSWSAIDKSFGSAPNEFSISGAWGPQGAQPVGPQVAFVKQQGGTRVAIVSSTSPISLANVHNLDAAFKAQGVSIVYENDSIPFGSFDATSVALRMKQENADVIDLPIAIAPAISIVQAVRQQGLNPKVVVLATGYDPTALTAGIAGVYTTDSFAPYLGSVSSLTPPAQHLRAEMAKYEPKANLSFFAVSGYATADEFVHALQLAGSCPTRANIVSAMRAVKGYSAAGLIPQQIQYSPGITPDGNPATCQYFIKINQTDFSAPSQPTCGT